MSPKEKKKAVMTGLEMDWIFSGNQAHFAHG
jgi:hypothetical protein